VLAWAAAGEAPGGEGKPEKRERCNDPTFEAVVGQVEKPEAEAEHEQSAETDEGHGLSRHPQEEGDLARTRPPSGRRLPDCHQGESGEERERFHQVKEGAH
jgi:hypothetical protein